MALLQERHDDGRDAEIETKLQHTNFVNLVAPVRRGWHMVNGQVMGDFVGKSKEHKKVREMAVPVATTRPWKTKVRQHTKTRVNVVYVVPS